MGRLRRGLLAAMSCQWGRGDTWAFACYVAENGAWDGIVPVLPIVSSVVDTCSMTRDVVLAVPVENDLDQSMLYVRYVRHRDVWGECNIVQ